MAWVCQINVEQAISLDWRELKEQIPEVTITPIWKIYQAMAPFANFIPPFILLYKYLQLKGIIFTTA